MEKGTIVKYIGWGGASISPNVGRLARVVSTDGILGVEYFLGRGDPPIDLCIEWLDTVPDASINERYAFTSHTRVTIK